MLDRFSTPFIYVRHDYDGSCSALLPRNSLRLIRIISTAFLVSDVDDAFLYSKGGIYVGAASSVTYGFRLFLLMIWLLVDLSLFDCCSSQLCLTLIPFCTSLFGNISCL